MKKLTGIILCLLCCVTFCNIKTAKFASAEEIIGVEKTHIEQVIDELLTIEGLKTAGSAQELAFAQKLVNMMSANSSFTNLGEDSGLQTFSFISQNGSLKKSQNVVFVKDNAQTDKKIILSANYDVFCNTDNEVSQGANASVASVATLLDVASRLNEKEFGFDIEIVFFGASTCDFAGSKFFASGLTNKDIENIVLMCSLDNLVAGDYLYAYTGEGDENTFLFVEELSKKLNIDLNKLNPIFSLSETLSSNQNLSYTHVGMNSDCSNFSRLGVHTLYLFSGNNSSLFAMGGNESEKNKNITNTKEDNFDTIKTLYPNYIQTMSNVSNLLVKVLSANNVIEYFSAYSSKIALVWTDARLVYFLMFAIIILVWCGFKITYGILFKRAYNLSKSKPNIEVLYSKFSAELEKMQEEEIDQYKGRIEKAFKQKVDSSLNINSGVKEDNQKEKTDVSKETSNNTDDGDSENREDANKEK